MFSYYEFQFAYDHKSTQQVSELLGSMVGLLSPEGSGSRPPGL